MITDMLCYSATADAYVADYGTVCRVDMGNVGFYRSRQYQVGFLIEFAEQWKEKEPDEQHRLLANPWEFKGLVRRLSFRSKLLEGYPTRPRTQRAALLHLVFPDTFEAIVSVDHKERIAKAFEHLVTQPTDDVDRMLAQIRSRLEEEHGRGIHLYDDAIRKQWDPRARPSPNSNLWDDFVRRAREFSNRRTLDSYEVDYKLEIGRKLAEAREAVLDGVDDWGRLVNTGMTSSVVNQQKWDTLRPEKVIVMRSVGRAP